MSVLEEPQVRAAVRSFDIALRNVTDQTLRLRDATLVRGQWRGGETPPTTIAPYSTVLFAVDSAGVAQGVEGRVGYQLGDGELTVYFNNPYVGLNRLAVITPPAYEAIEQGFDPTATNASVAITITPRV